MSHSVGPAMATAPGSADFGDERYHIDDSEVYVWCPAGVRDSPLLGALGRVRGHTAVATVRNWNTVRRLGDML